MYGGIGPIAGDCNTYGRIYFGGAARERCGTARRRGIFISDIHKSIDGEKAQQLKFINSN
jgi:hypothetical protein